MSLEPEQLSFDVAAPAEDRDRGTVAVADAPDPLEPTREQAAAIDSRDRDVFLEAGAGTGKTRVLVDRYCDAVDLDEVEPERILAFTFTEKAAAEMRRRVRLELLRRAAAASEGERARRLADAARAGESAPITTIHGYCRRLLAAHPVAAGLDPGFRVLDADEAARLASIAFDEALTDLAAGDDAVAAIAAAYRQRRLRGLIRGAFEDLRNHGQRFPDLPPLQISAFEGKDQAERVPDPAELELAQDSYGGIRALLVAFGQRYGELKRERSGVDFDDLQLLSLELLRGSETIRASERERFDHLLVDEFQDTSPLQVALVRELRGAATRLFTVGDEFQSIYAFRGADLDSFRAERAASPLVLRLSGSFRSTPPIVAAVNAVGEILLEGFNPLRIGRDAEPDAPGLGRGADPAVELLLTQYAGWGTECDPIPSAAAQDSGADRIAEARYLARRLRELIDAGEAEAGRTVLLLRAFSHVDVYAEALELAGLDPYVVGGRGYWSSQQVEDALRLLACVANPLDDEALFGALASPAAAASPDALWLLRRAAGRGRHVWPTLRDVLVEDRDDDEAATETLRLLDHRDREALERFASSLLSIRAEAAQLPLETLVERTLEAFDYDLAALTMSDGRRRAANLLKLVRMAAEFEAHEGRDLRGFLEAIAARSALSDREAEAATAAEEHDGVTVMTIHAAKGLEFDTVAVADLSRAHRISRGGSDLPVAFSPRAGGEDDGEASPPRVGLRLARAGASTLTVEGFASITDAAAQSEAEEAGRLIYVAASRARRRLLLSGTFKEKEANGEPREHAAGDSTVWRLLLGLGIVDDGESSVLDLPLDPPAAREGVAARFERPAIRVRFNRPTDPGVVAELCADRRPAAAAPAPPPGGTPPMTVLARRGASAARSLSYAALSEYSRCGYRFLIERVLGLGSGETASVAHGGGGEDRAARADGSVARLGFGRAVHELLETAAARGWAPPAAVEVEATLARQGAAPGRSDDAAAMVGAWLRSELLAELRAAGARFRPELGFRLALGSGTLIRGTLDLLAEVEGEPPVLIDFKTDARTPDPGAGLPPEYEIQRALYARAVSEALGVDRVRSVYVFLRSGESIGELLERADIAAGSERVDALVERIRSGDFAPTATPHRALCHDCPARRRLCPHPLELTGSEARAGS